MAETPHPASPGPRSWRQAAFVAASALAAAAWLFAAPRPAPPEPPPLSRGAWLERLVPPGEIVDTPQGVALQRRGDSGCRARVVAVEQAPAEARRAGAHALIGPASPQLDCLAWFDRAADALQASHPLLPVVRAGDRPAPMTFGDRVGLLAAALLVGALPALCALGLLRLSRAAPRSRRGAFSELQMFLWIFAVAAVARLLWPWRLTAVYFGYEWLAQAATLESLPRYGPGATALWGMVLGPLTDHRAVLALQAVCGAATCGAAALAVRRAGAPASAGWAAGLALALTPVVLRDHTSESMHVPALLGTTAAMWAGAELGRGPTRLFAALLWVGVAFAAACRFDVGPLALAASLLLAWLARSQETRQSSLSKLALLWVPPTLAVALALLRAAVLAERDLLRGNLPQLAEVGQWLPQRLASEVLLWRGDWLPLGWWLAPLAWLAWGRRDARQRHAWLGLIALALAAVLPSWIDYNETSLPRLQQPAALLAIVASAALGAQLHAQAAPRRWVGPLLVALTALTALPTLANCLRVTNAHLEDELLRRAAADLRRLAPGEPAPWLAVRSYADGDTRGLHLHQPTWLFGAARLTAVSALRAALDRGQRPDRPVYLLRSLRCHAAPLGAAHPGELADCRDLATRPGAEAIWQVALDNRGDTETFDWYGRQPRLLVGLYRLGAPAAAAPSSLPLAVPAAAPAPRL